DESIGLPGPPTRRRNPWPGARTGRERTPWGGKGPPQTRPPRRGRPARPGTTASAGPARRGPVGASPAPARAGRRHTAERGPAWGPGGSWLTDLPRGVGADR